MSMPHMLLRRLTTRLNAGLSLRIPAARLGASPGAQRRTFAAEPLLWRTPWPAWQFLSWATATLLAPPFWMIGTLLLINAHSDQPFFWPATMAIVAITNIAAIVHTNQRHHRRRFTGYMPLALHYFSVSMVTGSALLLLLIWATGILQDFSGPLAATAGAMSPLAATLWTAAVTASFGVLSFTHAGLLYAWLAFEG